MTVSPLYCADAGWQKGLSVHCPDSRAAEMPLRPYRLQFVRDGSEACKCPDSRAAEMPLRPYRLQFRGDGSQAWKRPDSMAADMPLRSRVLCTDTRAAEMAQRVVYTAGWQREYSSHYTDSSVG